jgi:CRP-like cAMP-binding protein
MTTEVRAERSDHVFPTLVPEHVARLAAYGERRHITTGEILLEPGATALHCYVVVRGALEILRETREGETLIHRHGPGQFTGEANLLAGRRSLVRVRVVEDGEVIAIERALCRHAARQGIPHAERPSISVDRPRSRRRRAGIARHVRHQTG